MGSFQEGYDYFSKSTGAIGAAMQGKDYIQTVEREISKLENALHKGLKGKELAVNKAKGFAAEYWHAGTYNVDAALRGSTNRAQVAVDDRSVLGSPDIIGAAGEAGLKYYGSARDTAKQQAKSLFERYKEYTAGPRKSGKSPMSFDEYSQQMPSLSANDPLYSGQVRIVPKEQLKEIESFLKRKITEEGSKRPEQVKRYQDTLNLVQDRLKDHAGNESIPLSVKESEQIAQLAEKGKFDASMFGISTEELIKLEYIKDQALQAGISAAAISIALKTAPEIVKGIRYLMETGEIDKEQLKKTGRVALSSSAEGFLRGTLSASITITCKAGLLGEAMKAVSPVMVSGIVVFAMDALKGGFCVLTGSKTSQEFGQEMAREAFSTVGAIAVGTAFNMVVPIAGYLIGSLLGSMLGSHLYRVVTKTTALDEVVAYFRQQTKLFEEYAAKLFKVDLNTFRKQTQTYNAIVEEVCAAKNEGALNKALHSAYKRLGFETPWEGDFNSFMHDKRKCLVFE